MGFLCDPNKNASCRKTSCFMNGGYCHHSKHIRNFDYKHAFLFFYSKWVKGYCRHVCVFCKQRTNCKYIIEVVLEDKNNG